MATLVAEIQDFILQTLTNPSAFVALRKTKSKSTGIWQNILMVG